MINQTPSNVPTASQQAFVPSVAVNRKGLIAITYYDFRFDGVEPEALTDYWAITCQPRKNNNCDDPAAWRERRLTETSFDLATAPVARGFFVGDYVGLAATKNRFVTAFSTASSDDPANVLAARFKRHGVGAKTE